MKRFCFIFCLFFGFYSHVSSANLLLALWEARFGDSRLANAVNDRNYNEVEALLAGGFDPNGVLDQYNHTNLHMVAQDGDLKMMKILISYGADIQAQNTNGESVLHLSIHSKDVEVIRFLIKKGAKINVQTVKYKITPLHTAVLIDEYAVVKLLLDEGADPSITDIYGNTPLRFAEHRENAQIIELLKNH